MIQRILIIMLAAVVLGGMYLGIQLSIANKATKKAENGLAVCIAEKKKVTSEDSLKAVLIKDLQVLVKQLKADSSDAHKDYRRQIEQLQTVLLQVRNASKQQVEILTKQVDLLKEGVIVRTVTIRERKGILGKVKVDSTVTESIGY